MIWLRSNPLSAAIRRARGEQDFGDRTWAEASQHTDDLFCERARLLDEVEELRKYLGSVRRGERVDEVARLATRAGGEAAAQSFEVRVCNRSQSAQHEGRSGPQLVIVGIEQSDDLGDGVWLPVVHGHGSSPEERPGNSARPSMIFSTRRANPKSARVSRVCSGAARRILCNELSMASRLPSCR